MKYPIGDLFTPPSYCIYNLTTTAISTGTTNNNGTTAMTTMLPSNQPLQKFVTHVLEFTTLTSEFHSLMNCYSYYPTTITARTLKFHSGIELIIQDTVTIPTYY